MSEQRNADRDNAAAQLDAAEVAAECHFADRLGHSRGESPCPGLAVASVAIFSHTWRACHRHAMASTLAGYVVRWDGRRVWP